jgi:hypothetical protein
LLGLCNHGPAEVFAQLAKLRIGNGLSLKKRGDSFVLRSKILDSLVDAKAVRREAQTLVRNLSGIARVRLQSQRSFSVRGACRLREDGKRDTFVFVEPLVMKMRGGNVIGRLIRQDGSAEV